MAKLNRADRMRLIAHSSTSEPHAEVPISRSSRDARYPLKNVDLARLAPRDQALLADPFPL